MDPPASLCSPQEMGLAFDLRDLEYYTQMFTDMGRDPTSVELFDIAQSNSEHSRHWFFGGSMVIDGKRMDKTLFELVDAAGKAGKGAGLNATQACSP
eukprot:362377-Chlamydomonas_euryale.AAC.5